MVTLVNRAKMATATTGTGTVTLGSAVDGYQTYASAGVTDGDVTRNVFEDGDAWEISTGTYTASGSTLTRTLVESSTGSLLNLSGEAVVYVSAIGEDIVQPSDLATVATSGSYSDLSGLPTLGTAAAADTGDFATASQGDLADTAVQPNDSPSFGSITVSGTVDGRDVASDGSKLDGIESGADVTDAGNVNPLVDTHLNTSTATSGEYLSWTGSDYDWVAVSGYTDADVDTHLNTGTAASGEVLSWNGTDYDWITSGGAFSVIGTNNLAAIATLPNLTTGTDNFAAGSSAAVSITSGVGNVAIGNQSLFLGESTTGTVAIGFESTRLIRGSYNVGIGYQALLGDGASIRVAKDTIAIGYRAGYKADDNEGNVFIGHIAGLNSTTGDFNVFVGRSAGSSTTTGSENVAVGTDARVGTTSGKNNSVGFEAGFDLTTGTRNNFFGYRAGTNATTSFGTICIGDGAGSTTTTGTNQIVVGYNATASSGTVDNEITLGNGSITTLRCQVTTITSLSDARDKTDIQPLNAGLEFVEALNPVSFTWNMRDGGKVGVADTGFIAQDLQAAQADTGVTIPDLVYDVNPDKLEAGYGKLIPVLVQAIKDLSDKVKDLETRLETN